MEGVRTLLRGHSESMALVLHLWNAQVVLVLSPVFLRSTPLVLLG